MEIDRDLRSRLFQAANAAMTRALERAGNRLKAKASGTRAVLKSVHPIYAAATMGPQLVAASGFELNDLIDGAAWDGLEAQYMTWGEHAQRQALELANRFVGLSGAQREALGVRQAQDLAEGWQWMKESMNSLAHRNLFAPDPIQIARGEFDPTARVPTGLVRQAVARAGGETAIEVRGTDVFVALSNNDPLGGIGTGELIMDTLTEGGALVEAYEWTYGPAFRQHPFEPHLDLDGLIFENFDSDLLTTGDDGEWVGDLYFPGDHDGCACDITPVLVLPEDLEE